MSSGAFGTAFDGGEQKRQFSKGKQRAVKQEEGIVPDSEDEDTKSFGAQAGRGSTGELPSQTKMVVEDEVSLLSHLLS
jgi:hypothetical protein